MASLNILLMISIVQYLDNIYRICMPPARFKLTVQTRKTIIIFKVRNISNILLVL